MDLDNNLIPEEENLKLTDRAIFTRIWTEPRLVFKYLNDNSYDKFIYALLFFGGISSAFGNASSKNMGDNFSLIGVIAICIIAGGIFGWISFYIYAAMLSWTGKWLDGKGDTDSLLRMIAFSKVPSTVALVLLVPQILLLGNGIFKSDFNVFGNGVLTTIIYFFTVFIEVALAIWTFVLFVIGLSEVQKLSIGKSILNLLLPVFVLIIPIMLIAFMFGNFFK